VVWRQQTDDEPGSRAAEEGGAITVTGITTSLELQGVRVEGQGTAVLKVALAGKAQLDSCILSGSRGPVVDVSGMRSQISMKRCQLEGGAQEGLRLQSKGEARVEDCVVQGNFSHGVSVEGGGQLWLHDCEVSRNRACGILVQRRSGAALCGNTIQDNQLAGIALVRCSADGITMENNTISSNGRVEGLHSEEELSAWSTVAAVQYRSGEGFPGVWREDEGGQDDALVGHLAALRLGSDERHFQSLQESGGGNRLEGGGRAGSGPARRL